MDGIERMIYAAICSHNGIKAKDIGRLTGQPKSVINHYLYRSSYIGELCYIDKDYKWHGLIRQARPHEGLGMFSGYYSTYRLVCLLCTQLKKKERNINDYEKKQLENDCNSGTSKHLYGASYHQWISGSCFCCNA